MDVASRYNAIGLHPVLLKGQGVGQYYRKPKHRCSGDIDLYFAEGIKQANELTKSWDGVVFEESTESHTGFKWHDLAVENHHKYVKFVSQKNKKAWEEVKKIIPLIYRSKFKVAYFEVDVLNPQINVLYVYVHYCITCL